MRTTLFGLVGILAVLGVAVSTAAQYGHPLKGTWSGDWGTSEDSRNRLLLQLDWDGEAVTGTINPGPNAVPISAASLDPSTGVNPPLEYPTGAASGSASCGSGPSLPEASATG